VKSVYYTRILERTSEVYDTRKYDSCQMLRLKISFFLGSFARWPPHYLHRSMPVFSPRTTRYNFDLFGTQLQNVQYNILERVYVYAHHLYTNKEDSKALLFF
jgi:hypothetical protein